MKERDHHPADLIAREILAKGKKALVIYGAAHMGLFGASKYFNLRAQIDAKQPGACSSSYLMSAIWKNYALPGSSATQAPGGSLRWRRSRVR